MNLTWLKLLIDENSFIGKVVKVKLEIDIGDFKHGKILLDFQVSLSIELKQSGASKLMQSAIHSVPSLLHVLYNTICTQNLNKLLY